MTPYGGEGMMRRKTLPERIDEALSGRPMPYADLAVMLWPDRGSHRYQSNGGPPGCYMALSAGLRRGKFFVAYDRDGMRTVHPRSAALGEGTRG